MQLRHYYCSGHTSLICSHLCFLYVLAALSTLPADFTTTKYERPVKLCKFSGTAEFMPFQNITVWHGIPQAIYSVEERQCFELWLNCDAVGYCRSCETEEGFGRLPWGDVANQQSYRMGTELLSCGSCCRYHSPLLVRTYWCGNTLRMQLSFVEGVLRVLVSATSLYDCRYVWTSLV